MKIKSIAASVVFAFAASGAQAAVLTFDGLNGWNDAYNLAPGMSGTQHSLSYEEQGFMLTLSTSPWAYGAHIGDAYSGGGTYNWHGDGDNYYGSYVSLTRVGGGAFDLAGFDYQNKYNGFVIAASGYADIALMGDGRNAMPYLNVTEVRFSGDSAYVALDNINVTASAAPAEVPEPGSAALLLAGLGLIGAAARRRKA